MKEEQEALGKVEMVMDRSFGSIIAVSPPSSCEKGLFSSFNYRFTPTIHT